jgi:hypothetical protein
MALLGGVIGLLPAGLRAQSSFTSFTSFNNNSGSSTDQAIQSTSQAALRDQTRQTGRIIDQHMRDIGREQVRARRTGGLDIGSSGLAAGSDPSRFSVWADLGGSYLKNSAGGANSFQGWSVTGVSGIDFVLSNSWVAGFSAGYVSGDFSVPGISGRKENYGPVVGPYVSYVITDNLTVDGTFNFSRQMNDALTGGTPNVERHFASHRWSGSVNGNYFSNIGDFQLASFAGYSYAYERQRANTDTSGTKLSSANVRYGAVKLGTEISYPIGNFEPYLPLTYEYQTTTVTDGTSRSDLLVGLGLRYTLTDGIKLGLLGTSEQFRSHMRDDSISANVRFSF